MKKLSPTSYALLGLLARKPWSAYELNAHMQRSVLKAFWPRAASHVYSEPKKLVARKLATARQETRSGRERTVYTITNAGREELAAWLQQPTETYFTMSFEAMLKFLYAEAADIDVLHASLDALENSVISEASVVLEGVRPMTSGEDTGGMPYNGMALNFLADVMEARLAWVQEARKQLVTMTETGLTEESLRVGVESYQQLIGRLESIVEKHPGVPVQIPDQDTA